MRRSTGTSMPISARITGHVVEVLTEEERYVNAGDVIVRIDPKDYEVAVAKAEADVANAEANLDSSQTNGAGDRHRHLQPADQGGIGTGGGGGGAGRGRAAVGRCGGAAAVGAGAGSRGGGEEQKARDDETRYKLLVVKDEISKQIYDTAVSTRPRRKRRWRPGARR